MLRDARKLSANYEMYEVVNLLTLHISLVNQNVYAMVCHPLNHIFRTAFRRAFEHLCNCKHMNKPIEISYSYA